MVRLHPKTTRGLPARDADVDPIGGWLAALRATLRLSPAETDAVCTELESHLRERVRDLVLAGTEEHEAARHALAELGEAGTLAASLRDAHRPWFRRLSMYAMPLGLGAAALITAGALMTTSSPPPLARSQFQPETPPARMTAETYDFQIEAAPLAEVVDALAETSGASIVLNQLALEDNGVDLDNLRIAVWKRGTLAAALDLVCIEAHAQGEHLAWRAGPSIIEFATEDTFDRREMEFVCYDIASVIDAVSATDEDPVGAIRSLILEFVTPDLWEDNGGALGQLQCVGSRLFVRAPRRSHENLGWILDELRRDAPGLHGGAAPPEPVAERIAPGEVVTMMVYELYEPSTWCAITRRVGGDGGLEVPEVGRVVLATRTAAEAEDAVEAALTAVINAPRVVVLRDGERMESIRQVVGMTGFGGGAGPGMSGGSSGGQAAGGAPGSGGSGISGGGSR